MDGVSTNVSMGPDPVSTRFCVKGREELKVAAWNCRTMLQSGAEELIAKSLSEKNIDVACLSEVRPKAVDCKLVKPPRGVDPTRALAEAEVDPNLKFVWAQHQELEGKLATVLSGNGPGPYRIWKTRQRFVCRLIRCSSEIRNQQQQLIDNENRVPLVEPDPDSGGTESADSEISFDEPINSDYEGSTPATPTLKSIQYHLSTTSLRPEKLDCKSTVVIGGRHYIDTSDESSVLSLHEDLVAGDGSTSSEQMVSFVAEDLQEKIKSGSQPHSADSHGTVSSSNSSIPSPYPPLLPDPNVLRDLESQAHLISHNVDRLLIELKGTLHGMSGLTAECTQTYTGAVSDTCDSVDNTVKSTYQLLAKAEELSHLLRPIPKLAQQVKEIKRVLDLFESHMQKSIG